MTADAEPSAVQRRWEATARALHDQLRAMIPLVPAMKPDEVKVLADALDTAMCVEWKAAVFDKRIELELQKITGD